MANTKFSIYGLNHPSACQMIDTYSVAKKEFNFPSNSLDYICKYYGLKGKLETPKGLWDRCVAGDPQALKEMLRYNDNDVSMSEEVYLRMRPMIHSHPNVGLYMDTDKTVCPTCGSTNLEWSKFYITPVNRYRTARCQCGAMVRTRGSMTKRAGICISLAK